MRRTEYSETRVSARLYSSGYIHMRKSLLARKSTLDRESASCVINFSRRSYAWTMRRAKRKSHCALLIRNPCTYSYWNVKCLRFVDFVLCCWTRGHVYDALAGDKMWSKISVNHKQSSVTSLFRQFELRSDAGRRYTLFNVPLCRKAHMPATNINKSPVLKLLRKHDQCVLVYNRCGVNRGKTEQCSKHIHNKSQ